MVDSVESAEPRAIGALECSTFLDVEEDEAAALPPELVGCACGSWLRSAARPGPAARAYHGAIQDDRISTLRADAKRLVHEGSHTFWIGADSSPRCALEAVALDVLSAHSDGPLATAGESGAEFWVQVRSSNASAPSIGLHWDTDEEWKSAVGEHVPPYVATVTYLCQAGAPTLVLPVAADARGAALSPCALGAFLSYPRPGKHLVFDGRLLHGALAHLSPRAEPTAAAEPYERVTLLVNVWLGHRPCGLRPLDACTAEQLSPIDGRPMLDLTALQPVDAVDLSSCRLAAEPSVGRIWRDEPGSAPAHHSDGEAGEENEDYFEVAGIEYPFYHPPVRMRQLPLLTPEAATDASLVYVAPSALQLSFTCRHAPRR